jgi:hypothetical protein
MLNQELINNTTKINNALEAEKYDDLLKFMTKRKLLNWQNSHLIYLFYIIHAAGLLIVGMSTNYSDKRIVWLGFSLNMLAGIIQTYEKINDSMLKKLLDDITKIKNGSYISESPLIDTDRDLEIGSDQIPLQTKSTLNVETKSYGSFKSTNK